jgi:hypothetical protein
MTTFFVPKPSADDRLLRASVLKATGVSFDGRYEKRLFRGDEKPPADLFCTAAGDATSDWLANPRRLPIVSERLALALRTAGLRGVDFYPVTVEAQGVRHVYAGLIARGRAELHVEKSGADFELQTGLRISAPLAVGGLVVEPATWDGSDVFIVPEYPLQPIFSERAAAAIRTAKPVGFDLVSAADYRPA